MERTKCTMGNRSIKLREYFYWGGLQSCMFFLWGAVKRIFLYIYSPCVCVFSDDDWLDWLIDFFTVCFFVFLLWVWQVLNGSKTWLDFSGICAGSHAYQPTARFFYSRGKGKKQWNRMKMKLEICFYRCIRPKQRV